jgi:hypothetical protein
VIKVELNQAESGVRRVSIRGKAPKLKHESFNHREVLQSWNRAVPHPGGAGVYRRMRGFSLAGVEESFGRTRGKPVRENVTIGHLMEDKCKPFGS